MRDYELALVLPGSTSPAKQKAIFDKIEKAIGDSGGKLGKAEEAGKKELAYPIKKEKQGIFFYAPLILPADKVKDFDRMLTTDEGVLRHLLVKSSTLRQGSGQASIKSIKGKKTKKEKR